jgi:hypothetical protein
LPKIFQTNKAETSPKGAVNLKLRSFLYKGLLYNASSPFKWPNTKLPLMAKEGESTRLIFNPNTGPGLL